MIGGGISQREVNEASIGANSRVGVAGAGGGRDGVQEFLGSHVAPCALTRRHSFPSLKVCRHSIEKDRLIALADAVDQRHRSIVFYGEGVFCFRFIQRSNQSFIPLTGVHASCPREIVEEEKCDLEVFPAMGEELVVDSVSPRGRPRAGSGEHYI